MKRALDFNFAWEALEKGEPEECATFGMFKLALNGKSLTACRDDRDGIDRDGPYVSAYSLAWWLAWNWWRIFHEPPPPKLDNYDWVSAHQISTIGHGYVWPKVAIYSDGARTVVDAQKSAPSSNSFLTYSVAHTAILPATSVQESLDSFFEQVQARLRDCRIANTEFDALLMELKRERSDHRKAIERRLEAAMGRDPGEVDDAVLERLSNDMQRLGESAVEELAAGHKESAPDAASLVEMARSGSEVRINDMFRPTQFNKSNLRFQTAHESGYAAAKAVRREIKWSEGPMHSNMLAQICGVSPSALKRGKKKQLYAFLLSSGTGVGRIVQKSPYETSRRFALARIFGDYILEGDRESLHPLTESHTYRQRFQRAFAAELLCPLEALKDELQGNFSEEARSEAARKFNVSERTVDTLLVNHKLIPRSVLSVEPEFELPKVA